ncbi:gamma-tubulin complex component 5-like [Glandiceps talaboti]
MATFDRKVESDVKKLIKSLTGFEESSENFHASVDFALSNFRFHRFLGVNSHKIERTLQGVREKFSIHSQPQKQEVFTKLIDKFLNSPLLTGQTYTKTDSHYGLLSLLLNLSNSPVNHKFEEKPKPAAQGKDEFDWAKYLLEDVEIPSFDASSDEEWSDDESTLSRKPTHDVKVNVHENQSEPDDANATLVPSVSVALHSGKEWLAKNVVVQYWKGQQEKNIWSDYPASNVCREWEKYCYETQPFYQPGTKATLTETQVVRETIWVLCGATQSFVYCHKGDRITCNPDIQVSHLTPNTLYNLLNYFAQYAQMLYSLYQYVQDGICHYHHHSDDRMSQTLQAFLSSLSWFLQKEFQACLCVIEKEVIKQDKSVTLTELKERISCHLDQISLLYEIYDTGIVRSNSNAAVLLTTMYDKILLMQTDTVEEIDRSKVCLLLAVFMQTTKPYLSIIDGWISNGTLTDPANEFIISRNQDIKTNSSNFWEKGYTIQILNSNEKGETVSEEKPAGQLLADQQVPPSKVGIPGFLEPILYKIILGGKSMDLLESLQRMTDKRLQIYQGKISLFDSFVTSLNKLWGLKSPVSSESNDSADEIETNLSTSLVERTNTSQLLQQNAQLQTKHQTTKSKRCVLDDMYQNLLSAFQERPLDIQLAMYRCLYPHIDTKCTRTSTLLVEVLKSQYELLDYLAAVRWFFLMEAGDTMYDFYVDVFEKLRLQEHWQDNTYLNLTLQDALQGHHATHMDRLKVSVEAVPKTSRLPINALDGLTLHYKVPWPVDLVLNSKSQRIYNDIFRLLLQVKRAKYCLDQLRFTDLTSHTALMYNVQHRVHLLRVRLMYFVNLLHNYIMTRILHSTGLEFQHQLTTASDLNQLLEIHTKYMKNIYERCLLNERMGYVREAIIKVLNLTLNFQKRWDAGINTISDQSLDNMEEEFKKCNSFLAKLFSNAVKRGAFPHMELLAQSLQNTVDNEIFSTLK